MKPLALLPIAALLLLISLTCFGQKKPVKVACIGNSITWGSGIENRAEECYPNQLQKLLGSGYEVHNFGVSGATMLKLGDKPYWREGAFREALAFAPDIVIIKLGTNDSKPHNWDKFGKYYKEDYLNLIKEFKNLPSKPKVYVCLPAPAFAVNFAIRPEVIDNEVIPAVKEVAKESGSELVDLYTPLQSKAEFFPDMIHPDGRGAKIIAETVYKSLKK